MSSAVVPPLAEDGRGVVQEPREDVEDMPGVVLFFCGCRCAKGNKGSGGFLFLLNLKKGVVDFLGVALGLEWDRRSLELTSDLEDSDCRGAGGVVNAVPLEVMVACVDGLGESGSSNVANDGRPLSSGKDFCNVFLPWLRGLPSSSRGMSFERRNLAASPRRDDFFLGPLKSFVGAVVIISGAGWC